jgi:aminoacyl tRNA synthase complex-interacting multifunctional protein 1
MEESSKPKTASELLEFAILDLQCRLGRATGKNNAKGDDNKKGNKGNSTSKQPTLQPPAVDLPDICKLEFKVGKIVKVWSHPEADKLYCEEIDVGEETPRQIASGLRPHFTLEEMQGQRLLVVSNLKAKNLVGFKSHGMVLCAADDNDKVEFVEPPPGAHIGEVVAFEGLPTPQPLAPSQVEKKKVFAKCMEGMKTTGDKIAVWNGHAFMTTAGPCTVKTIQGGVLR